MASLSRRAKGKRGEDLAAQALAQMGYQIEVRNWRCALGEIDLIAQKGDDLVLIEVRARSEGTDTALETFSARKRARMLALAEAYLESCEPPPVSVRIDVVVVDLRSGAVEVIEHALGW